MNNYNRLQKKNFDILLNKKYVIVYYNCKCCTLRYKKKLISISYEIPFG